MWTIFSVTRSSFLISFTDRRVNFNYIRTLLWQTLHKHRTKIVSAWKIFGRRKAKTRQILRNTVYNKTLLANAVANVLTGFFCKDFMINKSLKEKFKRECKDIISLVYRKGQWNTVRTSTVQSTKWLKISQAGDSS